MVPSLISNIWPSWVGEGDSVPEPSMVTTVRSILSFFDISVLLYVYCCLVCDFTNVGFFYQRLGKLFFTLFKSQLQYMMESRGKLSHVIYLYYILLLLFL